MALTDGQKKWVVGGTIGAAALLVGYGLFHSRPVHAGPMLPGPDRSPQQQVPPDHHGRRKRRHDDHDQARMREPYAQMNGRGENGGENGRGEYGRKKKHHHRKGHHKHG